MSFSDTKLSDIETGAYVVINATKDEMRNHNSYRGDMGQGTVAKVSRMYGTFTSGNCHFQLEGNTGSGLWLHESFVTILEGSLFEHLDNDEGDVVLALQEGCDITKGERYEIFYNEDEGELGFMDDDDDFREDAGGLWINVTKAAASVMGKPAPKKFGELTDSEKGELLLSKHEGSSIQRVNWANNWVTIAEPSFSDDSAYRVTPSKIADLEARKKELEDAYHSVCSELRELNNAA